MKKRIVQREDCKGEASGILRSHHPVKHGGVCKADIGTRGSATQRLRLSEAKPMKRPAPNRRNDPEAELRQSYAELNELYNGAIRALRGLLFGPGDGFGHNSREERQAAKDAIARADARMITSSQ